MKVYTKPEVSFSDNIRCIGINQASSGLPFLECANQSPECIFYGETTPAETGVSCSDNSIYFRFYYLGMNQSTYNTCTITINGQPLNDFCNQGLYPGNSRCQNDDWVTNVQCFRTGYSCTGNETVVVSCPGFSNTTCEYNPNLL